ncbi:unnamed protein product [Boreogadus saida]
MDVTLAPGKQRVVALKKRIFLVMLSPTIKVVGETRGCGECKGSRVSTQLGVGSTLRDRADEWGGEPAASGPGGWVTARAEVGCLPERLSTASFTILRREADVSSRGIDWWSRSVAWEGRVVVGEAQARR